MKKAKQILAGGLALILALSVTACGGKNPASDSGKTEKEQGVSENPFANLDTSDNIYMEARFTKDGKTGYIPMGNGECVEIQDENGITFAAASPDRQKIVVGAGPLLYVMNSNRENVRVISMSRASSRFYPLNEGVVFQEEVDGEKHLVRYTFADDKKTDVGACERAQTAEHSLAMAGIHEGELSVLLPDSDQIIRCGGIGNEEIVRLRGVSGDGKTVLWTEETGDFMKAVLYTLGENGEAQTLGEIKDRGNVYCQFSADSKLALVLSQEVNHLYLKDGEGQWKRVELPGDMKNETGVFETDAGLFHKVNADEMHYIYIRCANQLCAVSPDGNVTVIRDSVRDFDILNGMLYYSDGQKNVYASKINGTEISEETQLLQGVDTFAVSESGNYLYSMYVHEDDEKVRSLSVCPLGKEGAEETVLSENIYADEHVYLMADSEDLFYLDDTVKIDESEKYIGVLKVYHADTGETETIDEDVFKNTFINGKESVLLSEYAQSMAGTGRFVSLHGDLTYKKKPAENEDGYRFDWYYYDGTESSLMAANLEN